MKTKTFRKKLPGGLILFTILVEINGEWFVHWFVPNRDYTEKQILNFYRETVYYLQNKIRGWAEAHDYVVIDWLPKAL